MATALKDDYGTILAVPCDQPIILSREAGEKLLMEIKNKKPLPMERENLASEVKALFTKPVKK